MEVYGRVHISVQASEIYACELARVHMCCTEEQYKPRGVRGIALECEI